MGQIFSSISDCFNKMFSNKSENNTKKEQFNILPQNETTENSKKVHLIELENIDNKNERPTLSPKGDKETYQAKDFKTKVTLKDFHIKKLLGKGAFGKVILVYNEELQKYFAMKVLKKRYIKECNQMSHTKAERRILEKIDYPFISKLYFAFQNEENLYMITEYMAGGEMFFHLHQEQYFDEEKSRFYIAELILAIDHLHKNNVLYRDLKPENILLDEEGHIKLTDFGLSKIVNDIEKDRTYTICGTPIYVAPEVLERKGYNKLVDWWSLGVLLYEFLTGYSPYAEARRKIDLNIYYKPLEQNVLISDCAFDLISKLCETDVNKRLGKNVDDIKNHPFFKDIDWKMLEQKKLQPPFVPRVRNSGDVSNFDTMFTRDNPESTAEQKKFLNEIPNKAKNDNVSPSPYQNFTYVKSLYNNKAK